MLRCSCSHIAGSYRITSALASPPPFVRALVKPFLGSSSISQTSSRAVLPHRHFGTSCKAMGKVDDPSQAFHSGQAKARSALDEMSGTGEFKRTDSTYRDHIKKGTRFEPEGIHGRTSCLSSQILLRSQDCLHGHVHTKLAYFCSWKIPSLYRLCLSMGKQMPSGQKPEGACLGYSPAAHVC